MKKTLVLIMSFWFVGCAYSSFSYNSINSPARSKKTTCYNGIKTIEICEYGKGCRIEQTESSCVPFLSTTEELRYESPFDKDLKLNLVSGDKKLKSVQIKKNSLAQIDVILKGESLENIEQAKKDMINQNILGNLTSDDEFTIDIDECDSKAKAKQKACVQLVEIESTPFNG